MATARPFLRIAVAGACGVTFLFITVAMGDWLGAAHVDTSWLVLPGARPIPDPLDAWGDLVLNLVKGALVLASVALVVLRSRQSMSKGLQVAVVLLLANASVQALKHLPGPSTFVTGVEPLSGHAALVAAVALTWLVTAHSSRLLAAGIAVVSVSFTCLIAIAPGRHSPIQVVCPLVICLGWALGLLFLESGHRGAPQARQSAVGAGAAALGLSLAILSLGAPSWWPETFGVPEAGARLVLVVALVFGSALFVVAAAVAWASVLGKQDLVGPGADRRGPTRPAVGSTGPGARVPGGR